MKHAETRPSDEGDRAKPTIYDVAREAGISIGTVSRVFNDKRDVSAATRAKVLESAKRLNYMPQLTARRLTVGLVMDDVEKIHEVAYVGAILCGLANHAAHRGIALEIVPIRDIEVVFRRHLSGLIGVLFGKAALKLASVSNVPVVLINNAPEKGSFHVVASDHAEGARLAAQYLLNRGHRRIAAVGVDCCDWGMRERQRGFRSALESAGMKVRKDPITCLDGHSIEEVFDPLLRKGPTAVVVFGEDLSIAITDNLVHRMNVRVPDDLSLLTYEVPLVSSLQTPPQTTIVQPWERIARMALDTLLDVIRAPGGSPRRVLLPNQLIERASVRAI